jgi:predicted acylesterase/phospholipase RssA
MFAGNTPETHSGQMKKPGYFETLFRVTEVQMCSLAELHSSDCDFLITPPTSHFPFEDFTRGKELFDVGYQAGLDAVPRLLQEIAHAINVPQELVGG